MRLFVTGGAGFIGSNFIRHILSLGRNYQVVNFDKLTYAGNLMNLASVAKQSTYSFVRGDICNHSVVAAAMNGCGAVVNFAAESHVDRSLLQPISPVQTNVLGTAVLLEVARSLGVSRFVQISSDEVYGDISPPAQALESSLLAPSSPYSASKAAADLLVLSYVRSYGLPALITRSSNNYGPLQFPEKFLPIVILNALDNCAIPLYGDGKQQRDWLHVEDHCAAIVAVLERGRVGQIYNIGTGETLQNLRLAQRVLEILQKPQSLISHVKDRPGHDRRYALACSMIQDELGWNPRIPLDQGLRETIAWYQTNASWIASVRSKEYLAYYKENYEARGLARASE